MNIDISPPVHSDHCIINFTVGHSRVPFSIQVRVRVPGDHTRRVRIPVHTVLYYMFETVTYPGVFDRGCVYPVFHVLVPSAPNGDTAQPITAFLKDEF